MSAAPRRRGLLALLTLLGSLGCETAPPAPGALRGAAPPGAIWALTYNVNFEQPDARTVRAIERADADLVFLQETTPDWERRMRRLRARYPHRRFRHVEPTEGAEGGMAILSRYPLEEVSYRPSPAGGFPASCARVQTPLGALDVLHVHLHPPLDEEGRLLVGYFTTGGDRREEIAAHLGCFEGPPDLVLGDFNEEVGDAVRHLEELGMAQAQRAFGPPERTWTWDVGATELEGRPDHIFHGPRLTAVAVQVMELGGSDHRPLRAAFTRASGRERAAPREATRAETPREAARLRMLP